MPGFPTGSASPIMAKLPACLAVIERLGIVWGLEARDFGCKAAVGWNLGLYSATQRGRRTMKELFLHGDL